MWRLINFLPSLSEMLLLTSIAQMRKLRPREERQPAKGPQLMSGSTRPGTCIFQHTSSFQAAQAFIVEVPRSGLGLPSRAGVLASLGFLRGLAVWAEVLDLGHILCGSCWKQIQPM